MAKKTKKNIAKKKKKPSAAVSQVQVVEAEKPELTEKEIRAQEKAELKAQKEADKEFERKKREKEKEQNPGFFKRCGNYFKGTVAELKKVQWLDNEQLMKASGAVAVIVAAFTGVTWVADSVLGALASLLLGL